MISPISCLIATLGVASAHTIMQAISADGTQYPQGHAIYMPQSNQYQSDVTANTMACNGAPATGFQTSSDKVAVTAGSVVTGKWRWQTNVFDSTAGGDILADSHKGPVMAYMKKVTDATQSPSNAAGDGWFKIAAEGLISSSEWATDKLLTDVGIQSVTIPSCIEDGDYLLRFEIIALHNAGNQGQAQFYIECAQLSVTGGTGTSTPTTYSIPGIYSATDPGILVSIYNGQGQPYPSGGYTIPGPSVFTCGSSSSSSGSSSSSSSSPPSYSSSSASSSSAPSYSSSSAPSYSSSSASSSAAPTNMQTSYVSTSTKSSCYSS